MQQREPETVRDVVCGMEIPATAAAATERHNDQTYFFCSERCVQRFRANPERYIPHPRPERARSTREGGAALIEIGPEGVCRPIPSATTGVPEGAQVVYVELPIEQLHCIVCAARLQQALAAVAGVCRAFVNAESSVSTVVYDRTETGLPELAEAVRRAGHLVGSLELRIGISGMT